MIGNRGSILIVDDEQQIAHLIRECLQMAGFTCVIADSGCQARHLLERQEFSVVIADILLPGMTGLELLASLRRTSPQCRIILMTGGSDERHLADALSLGAYDFLQKPLDLPQLVDAVVRASESDADAPYLSMRAARAMQREGFLRQASLETIRALAKAVEAKDPYTHRHSEQVAHYATNLAGCMSAPEELIERIRVAALLHDIGKIGIPDNILTKPGSLTNGEFEYIRKHPALGEEILKNISVLASEARIVRHHHERWDGRGYPDGLSGSNIPLASRIINIADSMDAMLNQRTYKLAYSLDKALHELKEGAGRQFDPELAPVMIEWCLTNPDKLFLAQPAAMATA